MQLVDRPPFLAYPPDSSNSFTMRFYYKTQPGFAFPGQTTPSVGTIVPYLRPLGSASDARRGIGVRILGEERHGEGADPFRAVIECRNPLARAIIAAS